MSRNNHSSILRNIPSCLLRSLLHYETTESTKIDIFLLTQRSLYLVHESFNHGKHRFASMPVLADISFTISDLVISLII